MTDVVRELVAAGLSRSQAENNERLFASLERALSPRDDSRRWFVPGRIEVLGKHTDYAGGRSLLCATERGMCVMAEPREDAVVRVIDALRGESVEVPLSSAPVHRGGWGNYVGTVVTRLARNFPEARVGANIAIASGLPSAAGLSSSSVLVVAIFSAVAATNRLPETSTFQSQLSTPEHLSEYLGCVENGQTYGRFAGDQGVGTFGGSEDHTAILCSRPGFLACYRFCPIGLEQLVQMPDEWIFVIGSSGVHAHKAGAARDLYNRASRMASAVLDAWRSASGTHDRSLGSALREHPGAAERIRDVLAINAGGEFTKEQLRSRFEHFLLESEVIIPSAVSALASGDMSRFGDVVARSQSAAEQLLRNQVPETIALAKTARQLGAVAASAFGAGFGGSVWALVHRCEAEDFLRCWRDSYRIQFPGSAHEADFFMTRPGPAMLELQQV